MCAGLDEAEVSKQAEEVARTPSIVAEAMSKALPDSRASPADEYEPVDTPPDSGETNTVKEDDGTDEQQQVPVVDDSMGDDVATGGQPEYLNVEVDAGHQQVPVVNDSMGDDVATRRSTGGPQRRGRRWPAAGARSGRLHRRAVT